MANDVGDVIWRVTAGQSQIVGNETQITCA
jgi:hypothetical protein